MSFLLNFKHILATPFTENSFFVFTLNALLIFRGEDICILSFLLTGNDFLWAYICRTMSYKQWNQFALAVVGAKASLAEIKRIPHLISPHLYES